MYLKRHRINSGAYCARFYPFCSETRIHRSQSFYARGGVDLRGSDPRKPLPSAPDDPEHPGEVNLLTDATVDRLDLLDLATSLDHEADMRALEDSAGVIVAKED